MADSVLGAFYSHSCLLSQNNLIRYFYFNYLKELAKITQLCLLSVPDRDSAPSLCHIASHLALPRATNQ